MLMVSLASVVLADEETEENELEESDEGDLESVVSEMVDETPVE